MNNTRKNILKERKEFLDTPLQEQEIWEALKLEAQKRRIKTMRQLLKKVPYHELRNDEILKQGEARAFINLLIYYNCFRLLDLSLPDVFH